MSSKQKDQWSLDRTEVSGGFQGSSSGKPEQFARRLKTTSSRVFLTHVPTGIKVEGTIPPGNYSKKEMRKKREELEASQFKDLENMVAKHLGISGR